MSTEKPSVVYAIDDNYTPHFTASLTSLLEFNLGVFENFFVVTSDIDSEDLKTALKYFKNVYDVELNILNSNKFRLEISTLSSRLPLSPVTYYRLFLGEILPRGVTKALYLDADTIILDNLTELTDLDFSVNSIMAVPESRFVVNSAPKTLVSKNLIGKEYFNTGILYINVELWRSKSLANELIDTGILHKESIQYWDQDILNIYFKNKIDEIDSGYNVFRSYAKIHPHPKIVHFAGPVKPWHLFNSHPYRKEYRFYRNLTPFKFSYVKDAAPKDIFIQFLGHFKIGRKVLGVKRLIIHRSRNHS